MTKFDFKAQLKVGDRGEGWIPFSTNSYTEHTHFRVDKEYVSLIEKHSWYVQRRGSNYYIRCSALNGLDLHKLILPTGNARNVVVDHIGFWWDNRKENLRLCTSSGNNRNRQARISKYSEYLGLCYDKSKKNPWRGRIGIQVDHKKATFSGPARETAEEAAADYDALALLYHGEFANLNFPEDRCE